MTIHPLTLLLLPETFAICQFAPGTPLPEWVPPNSFFSLTNTSEEGAFLFQCQVLVTPPAFPRGLNGSHSPLLVHGNHAMDGRE